MKTERRYCIQCKKLSDHVAYSEDREIDYLGRLVEYHENGFICGVCGAEDMDIEEYKTSMQEIRDSYHK